jgi:hypothetical protein
MVVKIAAFAADVSADDFVNVLLGQASLPVPELHGSKARALGPGMPPKRSAALAVDQVL